MLTLAEKEFVRSTAATTAATGSAKPAGSSLFAAAFDEGQVNRGAGGQFATKGSKETSQSLADKGYRDIGGGNHLKYHGEHGMAHHKVQHSPTTGTVLKAEHMEDHNRPMHPDKAAQIDPASAPQPKYDGIPTEPDNAPPDYGSPMDPLKPHANLSPESRKAIGLPQAAAPAPTAPPAATPQPALTTTEQDLGKLDLSQANPAANARRAAAPSPEAYAQGRRAAQGPTPIGQSKDPMIQKMDAQLVKQRAAAAQRPEPAEPAAGNMAPLGVGNTRNLAPYPAHLRKPPVVGNAVGQGASMVGMDKSMSRLWGTSARLAGQPPANPKPAPAAPPAKPPAPGGTGSGGEEAAAAAHAGKLAARAAAAKTKHAPPSGIVTNSSFPKPAAPTNATGQPVKADVEKARFKVHATPQQNRGAVRQAMRAEARGPQTLPPERGRGSGAARSPLTNKRAGFGPGT